MPMSVDVVRRLFTADEYFQMIEAGILAADAEPEDALLLVEVSDSSLRRDRELKLPLYARAGINEYWIVNVREEILEVYKRPTGSSYATVQQFRRPESVTSSGFPDLHLAVDEIFA
jgi:Uma2 family endonuclease